MAAECGVSEKVISGPSSSTGDRDPVCVCVCVCVCMYGLIDGWMDGCMDL